MFQEQSKSNNNKINKDNPLQPCFLPMLGRLLSYFTGNWPWTFLRLDFYSILKLTMSFFPFCLPASPSSYISPPLFIFLFLLSFRLDKLSHHLLGWSQTGLMILKAQLSKCWNYRYMSMYYLEHEQCSTYYILNHVPISLFFQQIWIHLWGNHLIHI